MRKNLIRGRGFLLVFALVTCAAIGSKSLGWLQSFEWAVFDTFMQLRPKEPLDPRIIIVALTEQDIQKLNQYPVSDRTLAKLLNKIKQQKPRAIGLDIFRDVPVGEGQADLVQVFKTTPNLIGIQKVGLNDTIQVHPVLKQLGQVSTVDTIVDGDRKIRRALLYPTEPGSENTPNLGLALAFEYLKKEGIDPESAPDKSLQLDAVTFPLLTENDGGYARINTNNYQILTNYRGGSGSFTTVSFNAVLSNEISPTLMKDRIVLIGAKAESVKDLHYTPYSKNLESTPEQMAGVEINANVASQIISTVLENRPLFKFVPEEFEDVGVFLITVSTLFLLWKSRPASYKNFSIFFIMKAFGIVSLAFILIVVIGYFAFLNSFWLPVAYPIIYLTIASFILVEYVYFDGIKTTNLLLEKKNKQLEQEQDKLLISNHNLEEKTLALHDAQSILVLALDAATTAIWDWDLREDEVYIMHNCNKLIGWGNDCERMRFDKFLNDCVRDEDRELVAKQVKKIIEGDRICQFEFCLNTPYDDNCYLEVKGEVQHDETEQPIRIIGTLSNITLQKVNSLYLSGTDKKHKALTVNSFDLGILLDENLDFRYISPAINRILGYDTHELYWQNIINYIHPEDVALFNENIKRVSEIPANIIQFKYRHLHKEKSWRVLETVVSYYLHDPFIHAFVINSRDVTELTAIAR